MDGPNILVVVSVVILIIVIVIILIIAFTGANWRFRNQVELIRLVTGLMFQHRLVLPERIFSMVT